MKEIENLMKAKDINGINSFIDKMVPDTVPLNESKVAINYIAKNLGTVDNETALKICEHAIQKLRARQL